MLWTLGNVRCVAGSGRRAACAEGSAISTEAAVTSAELRSRGLIADILYTRGRLDEALRIRREEELPVYERLGDVRSLLVGRANLALLLLTRNQSSDRDEAQRLLCLALADARRMQLPEAQQIEAILQGHRLSCADAPERT